MNILKQEEDFEAAISDAKKIREVDPKFLKPQLEDQIIPELEVLKMNKKLKYERGELESFLDEQLDQFHTVKEFLVFLGETANNNKQFFSQKTCFFFNFLIKIERLYKQDAYTGKIRLNVFFADTVKIFYPYWKNLKKERKLEKM